MKKSFLAPRRFLLLAMLLFSDLQPATVFAQGTAFTYQGFLTDGGNAYTGYVEFQPTLWNAVSGGSQVAANHPATVTVGVTNGLFVLPLDFGGNFPGANRWLQIEVRVVIGPYTLLSPRQPLAPTPYAITASNLTGTLPAVQLSGTLPSANLGGLYSGVVTFNNAGNSFTGTGAGLTSLDASQLASGTVPDARLSASVARTNQVWRLSGNAGTTMGVDFLGTADNQPLELRANNQRMLRLESAAATFVAGPNAILYSNAPNVIGGAAANRGGPGVAGAVIGGGGADAVYVNIGGAGFVFATPISNAVAARFTTISGGLGNAILTNATGATIGGGSSNDVGTNSEYSAIGGGAVNHVAADSHYATIAGGRANDIGTNCGNCSIGGGENNNIAANSSFSVIAGGSINNLGTNSDHSAIGGGSQNNVGANSSYGTIAGGFENDIGTNSSMSTIAGGSDNNIGANSSSATIAGGRLNDIGTNSSYSAIGGGFDNNITAEAQYATIPGGRLNTATNYAFAAGRRARANHTGTFVWGDSTDANMTSTGDNQFLIRANGGVGIGHNAPDAPLHVVGGSDVNLAGGGTLVLGTVSGFNLASDINEIQARNNGAASSLFLNSGGGNVSIGTATANARLRVVNATCDGEAWSNSSDRNLKAGLETVDAQAILTKVAALPLSRWYYTNAPGTRHLGPMAQDFQSAFGLGSDDKHIATVDADGVALAAIQGLNALLKAQATELDLLKEELKELRGLVGH